MMRRSNGSDKSSHFLPRSFWRTSVRGEIPDSNQATLKSRLLTAFMCFVVVLFFTFQGPSGDSLPEVIVVNERVVDAYPQRGPDSASLAEPPPAQAKVAPRVALPPTPPAPVEKRRAMFFTMDTLSGYQRAMKNGGPAGEHFIRTCLETFLESKGFEILRITSDPEFDAIAREPEKFKEFHLFFFDPWTIITPQHKSRGKFPHMTDNVYILDFFGETEYQAEGQVPLDHYLTPYPNKWNTYLGFFVAPPTSVAIEPGPGDNRRKGVIWGKEKNYFAKPDSILALDKDGYKLISVLNSAPNAKLRDLDNVQFLGTQPKDQWMEILGSASFLLGLGDPVLGPSPLEAMSLGLTYINIEFAKERVNVGGKKGIIARTQHDWLQEVAKRDGASNVCTAREDDTAAVLACAKEAVERERVPYFPKEVTRDAYDERAAQIFAKHIQG